MAKHTSEQLRFPTVEGLSVRGHFNGGAMPSDFGALLLSGIDRQIGLTERLENAASGQTFDRQRECHNHEAYYPAYPGILAAHPYHPAWRRPLLQPGADATLP